LAGCGSELSQPSHGAVAAPAGLIPVSAAASATGAASPASSRARHRAYIVMLLRLASAVSRSAAVQGECPDGLGAGVDGANGPGVAARPGPDGLQGELLAARHRDGHPLP